MLGEYKRLEGLIAEKEKELLTLASDTIKKLYLEIDFLCCKQNVLTEQMKRQEQ